jgi:tetratricopeptide (TPR) repeat protein
MSDNPQVNLLRRVRLALRQDQPQQAIDALTQLIALTDDIAAQGRHRGNLALIYYRNGQTKQALEQFQAALYCAQHEGDRLTENGLLGNIGNILREMGDYEASTDYLEQALLIAAELNDQRGRGIWLSNLGLLYDDVGDHQMAIQYHREAINIAQELSDQRGLAGRLQNLAVSHQRIKQFDQALQQQHAALTVLQKIGTVAEQYETRSMIAELHLQIAAQAIDGNNARTHVQAAFNAYRHALDFARQHGQSLLAAQTMRQLGDLFTAVGEHEQAIQLYRQAQQHFAQLDRQDVVNEIADLIQNTQEKL